MALDPLARSMTINFPGGYATMTRGLAEAIFGKDNAAIETLPTLLTRSVKAHSRTRVIGGPSTSVGAYQYTYDKYPTSSGDQASGGREVFIDLGDGEKWTARVGGSFANFASFLGQNATAPQVFFQSYAGTKYGPFTN